MGSSSFSRFAPYARLRSGSGIQRIGGQGHRQSRRCRALMDRKRESKPAPALSVEDYFQGLSGVIPRLPYADITAIIAAIMRVHQQGRTIFVCGNGGSAATASHMMCDSHKGTSEDAPGSRLKVMALTDNVALLTAWANDASYDNVFSWQLQNFVQPGHVLFASSA